jgi:hypothetical protein
VTVGDVSINKPSEITAPVQRYASSSRTQMEYSSVPEDMAYSDLIMGIFTASRRCFLTLLLAIRITQIL